MDGSRLPYLAWIALAFIWGSTFLFMKWATAWISPLQLVFVRVLFGFAPILAWALFRRQLRLSQLRHWPHFLAMALLAGILYFYGFARGVTLLPSGVAGAVTAAIPLFSMLAALLFLREERFTMRRATGLLAGLAGVLMIARPFEDGVPGTSTEGVLWMVGGCLSLGLSFVYARKYLVPLGIPAAAMTTWQMGFALLLLTPVTDIRGVAPIANDFVALAGLTVGLGVFATGLAYLIYYYIVATMGSVRASTVTYLSPVIALFIGAVLAGEVITPRDYVATAIIIVGVIILNRDARTA